MAAPVPMALFAAKDLLPAYNAAFVDALGPAHPAVLMKQPRPEWGEAWAEMAKPVTDVLAGRGPVVVRNRPLLLAEHAATTPRWGDLSFSPVLDEAGRIEGVLCLFTDQTAQKRKIARERQMAAIVDGSQDAILAVDLSLRIFEWNHGAAKLYGYRAEEIIGKSVEVILPEDRLQEEGEILERIRKGERVESYETARKRRDGSLVTISLTISPIYDEDGQIIGASKIARDISLRREAERMQRVLVQEMKHRVKNILATVLAIARQTLGKSPEPAAALFSDRILALARAQDLVTRDAEDGVWLAELVKEVIAPYSARRIESGGPEIALKSAPVLSVTLALHELATNAAKYGALSRESGCVDLRWSVEKTEQGEVFELRWRERGGPEVIEPEETGFGTKLLGMILASEIGGEVDLRYPPEGFECVIRAPLEGIALSKGDAV